MKFSIDFSEVAKLADDLMLEAAICDGRGEKAVQAATERLYARATSAAPVATGALKTDIRRDTSGLARRVYTVGVREGFYQEYGTSKMPPQPFLMVFSDAAHADLEREVFKAKWALQ